MKILVRGTNWIGDAVMSIPALRELRRIFPEDRITLHTSAWAEGLFQDADFLDDIVSYEKSRWRVKDIYENSQFLKGDGYDLAILLPNSFESALTTALSRIPRRIGYNKDARGLLLTDPIAVPEWKNRRHEAYYYLYLVGEVERRVLGRETVDIFEPETHLSVSEARKTAAREFLGGKGLDLSRKIVVFGVGSTNSRAKRWPAERFATLNDRLQQELGSQVVLLGAKDEIATTEEVLQISGQKPFTVAGQTDIGQAAAVLSVCDLLISNDMGLAHIAPAVGTPTIAIFGPTNPVTTSPFSPNVSVMNKAVECSPCMLRDCPIDHRCMTGISVDMVFNETLRFLNATDC